MTGYDHSALKNFNSNKIFYYAGHSDFIRSVKNQFGVGEVKVLDLTISYKGLICKTSYKDLLDENIITKRDVQYIASKAMLGSMSAFHYFYKSTT